MVPLDPRWLSHAHVREMQAHEVVIESRPICCANQLSNGVDENPRQQYGREPRVPRVVDEMHEPQDERQDETDDQIAQQPPEQHERDGGAPADIQRLVRIVP